MDRRVVVGLVGVALAGVAEVCQGQTAPARDPSAQYSVGMAPIPSITDSINNTTVYPSVVPLASRSVASSPVGPGQDASFPKAPVPRSPISMTTLDPINQSINRGVGTGSIASMLQRPANQPSAAILRTPPRVERVAKLNTSTIPSLLSSTSKPSPPAVAPPPSPTKPLTRPDSRPTPPAGS